jgi:transposase-like protein
MTNGGEAMAGRKKGKWSRRSQNEWGTLLARNDGSGLGVAEFCRREAISAASFYRWRKLLSDGFSRGDGGDTTAALVDLGALKSASSPRPRIDLKLDLGEGLILHLVRS